MISFKENFQSLSLSTEPGVLVFTERPHASWKFQRSWKCTEIFLLTWNMSWNLEFCGFCSGNILKSTLSFQTCLFTNYIS